jgi:hypothetical protein
VPRVGIRRLGAALATAFLGATIAAALPASTPSAGAAPAGGTTSTNGAAQINVLGHPSLCWQAWGNGSPVTLATCDAASQGQQWSLSDDGVLLNGNGYCLEAAATRGAPLFIDFAGQCGGGRGQVWRYRSGQLASPATGACAGLSGRAQAGASLVRRPCPSAKTAERPSTTHWSIGYSAVTLTPGTGSGPAGGTFTSSLTVANAASAQAAYGVAVRLTLPPGSHPTSLHTSGPDATGSSTASGPDATGPDASGSSTASGWTCDLRTVTCTGNLVAGASGRITLAGALPSGAQSGGSVAVAARVTVTGTSQRPGHHRTTATVAVAVQAPAPAPASGPAGRPGLPLIAVAAGALLLGGLVLVGLTRRRRPAAG